MFVIFIIFLFFVFFFFFSSRRRHTRSKRDWSSDVCSSDLGSRPMRASISTGSIQRRSKRTRWRISSAVWKIGRASCSKRVSISVVAVSLKKKKKKRKKKLRWKRQRYDERVCIEDVLNSLEN